MVTPTLRAAVVTLLALTLLAPVAHASDSHGASASASASASAKAKSRKKVKLSEAQTLHQEYIKFDRQAEKNKDCLLDRKCIKPEDGMLEASQEAARILAVLEKRAREGDNESALYLGMILYDQARLFSARADGLRDDQSVRPTYVMLVRRSQDVYARAGGFLAQAARTGEPEACFRYGKILDDALAGKADHALAYKLYRCAALGYIERDMRPKAVDSYVRMVALSDPRDMATAEVYAKLRPEEPRSPWRKPALSAQ